MFVYLVDGSTAERSRRRVMTTTVREHQIPHKVLKCLKDSLLQYPDHSRGRDWIENYEDFPSNTTGLHKIPHSARSSILAAFMYELSVYDIQEKAFFYYFK
jgi:hypothetical protein